MTEYIKREAVEEMLENAQMVSDGEYSGYCTEDVCIDKIPAADVVPKIEGKWIRKYGDDWIELYRCSVCDRQLTTLSGEGLADFPYCHCGAHMKGE